MRNPQNPEHILETNYTYNSEGMKNLIEQTPLEVNIEAVLVIDSRTRDLEVSARLGNRHLCLTGPYLKDTPLAQEMEVSKKSSTVTDLLRNAGWKNRMEICQVQVLQ